MDNNNNYSYQPDILEKMQSHLLSNEEILWTGKPDPSVFFSKSDYFLVPFSLLWGGFALFATFSIITGSVDGKNSEMPIFMLFIPFIFSMIGLYMIFGRFIFKRYKKQRTFYAVTNRRVLILTKGLRDYNLRAASINTIPLLNKIVGQNNIGTIVFGNKSFNSFYENSGMDFFSGGYGEPSIAFYDIEDVEHVYTIVSDLMNKQ